MNATLMLVLSTSLVNSFRSSCFVTLLLVFDFFYLAIFKLISIIQKCNLKVKFTCFRLFDLMNHIAKMRRRYFSGLSLFDT